jgi:endonuclease/exonuclease/phosphatase family metal-dependent hydrolase
MADTSDTITVLSYNVENLFDCVDNGTEFPDYQSKKSNWSYDIMQRKMANCASVISATKPDICVLCEVENVNAGRQLQKKIRMLGEHYRYFAAGDKPHPATTCQIILSKLPITMSQGLGVPKKGAYYTRNILETDITVKGRALKIFAVHWPSKRYPESYRIAAGKVLLKRIKELAPHTDYIIAGDFNSNLDEAETFFTERLDDTHGRTALNHLFKTVNSGPGEPCDFVTEKEIALEKEGLRHYDLWLELPESRRFSYIYRGRKQTLDHMLVPGALFDSDGMSYVDNSFDVCTWHGRLLRDGVPFRWQAHYDKQGYYHEGEGYSDHLPIIARFMAKPYTAQETVKGPVAGVDHAAFGDFENGFDGWVACDGHFRLSRDTCTPANGIYSLYIEGISSKSSEAARVRLPVKKKAASGQKFFTLSFKLRGTGAFIVRVKGGNTDWVHYNPVTEKTGKGFRYASFRVRTWRSVKIPFALPLNGDDALEIQIRSKGGEVLRLWIDEVHIE